MTVEVVTVWAPRRDHPNWREGYIDLMRLQKRTAEHFGHRHMVVTDDPTLAGQGFDTTMATLPQSLMKAMIDGVIMYLEDTPENGQTDYMFVDADVLVHRDVSEVYSPRFDIGLTSRVHDVAPINNGAMYIPRSGIVNAIAFFKIALSLCGDHWGADQEAISQAAAPVPMQTDVDYPRSGAMIRFLSMKTYNVIPKVVAGRHTSNPYAVHFKGDTKAWAQIYAEKFLLVGDGHGPR